MEDEYVGPFSYLESEKFIVFRQGQKLKSIFCKIRLHEEMGDYPHFEETVLGAEIKSKIIIGIGEEAFVYNDGENI